MMLPDSISQHLAGKTGHTDDIGMSGSLVTVYEDCVLKVEKEKPNSADVIASIVWLSNRLPTPRVICHEVKNGISWLLMTRIPGQMSCEERYLQQPEVLISALADGLKLLWSTDSTGCPRRYLLEDLLKEAAYRVENGLVDMDNVEPETFGKGGFRNPEQLLQWLLDNKPNSVPILAHGDYCLPNIFLQDGRFSGFIDVSDMGIGEKWRDIALCWRSLKHNTDGTYSRVYPGLNPDLLFEKLGIQPDWQQIRYHLLLDELF